MIYRTTSYTLLCLLCFALPGWGALQVDFVKALELAQKNNRTLKMAQADSRYAELQVREAYSTAMPVISAVGSYSHNFIIAELENDLVVNGEPWTIKMALGREHNFYGGISLQQPLWIAGKIGIGIQAAKIYRDMASLGLAQSESDLKMQVTQTYYGVLLAKEFYQLTKDTRTQIESHLKNARVMYEQGVVSEYDFLRAEVELANFQPQVIGAEEAYKVTLEALRIIMGLSPEEPFEVVGQLEETTPPEVEIDGAISEALARRADYRQLALQGNLFKQALKAEQRNIFWPSFFLTMNYQQQAQEKDFNFDEYFWGKGLSAGISVSLPLFDGFKTSSRIQIAKVNLRKQELMSSQMEDGVRLQVKTAVWQLEQAQQKLEASRKAVQQAEKGYNIAVVRYQSGISTQVELLDARLAQTQARIGELSTRYDIITAKAELEHAMGK